MEKYGFIYVWYDVWRKMYYIGCHWGNVDDGYICSSTRMRKAYRRRPNDFKRRIIQKDIPREVLLEEEYKWISLIPKEQLGKKYYNLSKRHFGHWSNDVNSNLSTREKITKALADPEVRKKITDAVTGRTHTEATKEKIRAARKHQVFTEETRKKMSDALSGDKNPFYGKTHDEETRKRMSEAAKNRKDDRSHNEETRKRMSEAAKNRKRPPSFTAEHRAKLSDALRARHARNKTLVENVK
jgi:hypothetical protein